MEMSDWSMASLLLKVELRFARVTDGAQCVITDGRDQMLKWFVDNWDYLQQVHMSMGHKMHSNINFLCTGTYPTYSASFGEGRGAIVLSNLGCLGNETRLVDCLSGNDASCGHNEDAGVRCLLQTGMTDNTPTISST